MRLTLIALCVFALGLHPVAAGGLSTDSPFMPAPNSPAGGGQAAAGSLEFHGIMEIGGVDYFNVVDLGTKKGVWVELNQTGKDFVVKAHERAADGDVIMVEQQGRLLRLALAKPKTIKASLGTPVAAPANQGPIAPVVLNPTAADEARRMEAFAAEVRRRRMLRQQEAAQERAVRQQERTDGAPQPPPPPPPGL